MIFWTIRYLLLLLILFPGLIRGQNLEEETSPVHLLTVAEMEGVYKDEPLWIAIHFEFSKPWHLYWKNPGDIGMGPQLEWALPEGMKVEELLWPTPEKFLHDGFISFGYDTPFTLLAKLSTSNWKAEQELSIGLQATWLACSDAMCLPDEKEISLILKTQEEPNLNRQALQLFAKARNALASPLTQGSLVREGDHLIFKGLSDQKLPSNINKVYFCAEDNELIDHRGPVELSIGDGDELTAVLPTIISSTGTELRGVLVAEGERWRKAYSIDLSCKTPLAELAELTELTKSATTPVAEESLVLTLFLAFLGGLCLNLMPCVLPVISLKVLNFIKMAGKERSAVFYHAVAFSIGVLISFWALASLLLILQAYGSSVGWGFQLQEPLFVAFLCALLFLLALSLFGIFEVGSFFAAWVGTRQAAVKEGYLSSFSSGILATAVATPCTGPFLGSAIGLAVTLPPIQALAIFTSLGCGMAFPYLILGAFPQFLSFLPKPGAWMEQFKQLMGFMMLATVLWLAWVFGAQQGVTELCLLLASLFLIALGCWLHSSLRNSLPENKAVRLLVSSLSIFCLLLAGNYGIQAATASSEPSTQILAANWEPFNPERVTDLQRIGTPVFIDFTAKWCLICQANHLILNSKQVADKMQEKGVVRMKADWTKSDASISEWLRRYGRSGVPLYLFFDSKGKVDILPQVLTPETVLASLGANDEPA